MANRIFVIRFYDWQTDEQIIGILDMLLAQWKDCSRLGLAIPREPVSFGASPEALNAAKPKVEQGNG